MTRARNLIAYVFLNLLSRPDAGGQKTHGKQVDRSVIGKMAEGSVSGGGGDGALMERGKGTPQGGVGSPVPADLFMHYVFEPWVKRNYPEVPLCR
jgi:hypothetical protein